MEDSAPETVVRGTLITCESVFLLSKHLNASYRNCLSAAASAFITGLYGISTRHPNYGLLSGAAAVNSGVTAFTLFSVFRPSSASYGVG